MTYRTNQTGNALTLTGEGEFEGTTATVPLSDVDGMNTATRKAHLDKVFADIHAQRLRTDDGIGSRMPR